MSAITTHVLDTARGLPAAGVRVTLQFVRDEHIADILSETVTDADGRARFVLPEPGLVAGGYTLIFATGAWYAARGEKAFHRDVTIAFVVTDPTKHHHVPLLLAPYGYTTYRGS